MSSIITGAIIGGIVGVLVVVIMFFVKDNKYKKLLASITEPIQYSALYHYASYKRYKTSFKFYDSFGILYLSGHTACYKTNEAGKPVSFNLKECTVQQEPDWRMLKWFSITTPAGEKFYFDSHKMGAFKNNSDETLKGLAVLKAAQA
jgi:hypothetical protein